MLANGQQAPENSQVEQGKYTYLYDVQADTSTLDRFLKEWKYSEAFALSPETVEGHFDRALEVAEQLKDDSYRIRLLNTLSRYRFGEGEYESAFQLAGKVNEQAEKYDMPDLVISSHYQISVILRRSGNFVEAMNHIQKGLEKAQAIPSKYWIMKGYAKMSTIHERWSERHKALENLLQAEKMADELGDLSDLAIIKVRIGRMFLDMNQPEKALQYRSTALDLAEQSGDSLMIATAKHRLGDCYLKLDNFEKALSLYGEAANYRKTHASKDRYAQILVSIAAAYYNQQQFEEALEYYRQALPNFKAMQHHSFIFHVYTSMGKIYLRMGDNPKARKAFEAAKTSIDNFNNYDLHASSYLWLSRLEARLQDYQKAYEYQKLHKAYYDSAQFNTQNRLLAYNEARFDFKLEEEKQKAAFDAQLSVKEQQIAYRNYLIAGFIVLTVIIIVLLILLYRSRAKQKEALDIISQKNRSLEELDEIKNNYFTILAHDLRNPFGALLQLSEMIDEYSKEKELSELEELTSLLKQSAHQFNNLLNSTLEWGRLQMSGMKVNKERLNLSDEVNRILSFAESSARMKDIEVLNKVKDDIVVYSDKDLLQAVLNNLVNNAIKFTEKEGEISVTADVVDQESVKVSVEDSGVGMGDEKLDTIFTPGENKSKEGTQGEKGTGFGLINSKKMVELNGGQMAIESEEGEGTVVEFTLSYFN